MFEIVVGERVGDGWARLRLCEGIHRIRTRVIPKVFCITA